MLLSQLCVQWMLSYFNVSIWLTVVYYWLLCVRLCVCFARDLLFVPTVCLCILHPPVYFLLLLFAILSSSLRSFFSVYLLSLRSFFFRFVFSFFVFSVLIVLSVPVLLLIRSSIVSVIHLISCVRADSAFQSLSVLSTRGEAASGFLPLTKIPHSCLPWVSLL